MGVFVCLVKRKSGKTRLKNNHVPASESPPKELTASDSGVAGGTTSPPRTDDAGPSG